MKMPVALRIAASRPLLKRLSRRFTQDADEASDLVQDTLLKALVHWEKFAEDTNLQGWLFTIMRNTFINRYRRDQRSKSMNDSTREGYYANIPDNHTFSSPERTYAWKDLWESIESLKGDLRAPFTLHTAGYKYHEIATRLNIPIGTVKNRIFQARKELQGRLA